MQISPTLGLSVLLHLFIVACGSAIEYVFGVRSYHIASYKLTARLFTIKGLVWSKRVLSLAIILGLITLTITLSTVAILTAFRIGAEDRQGEYMKAAAVSSKDFAIFAMGAFSALFTNEIAYDRIDSETAAEFRRIIINYGISAPLQ